MMAARMSDMAIFRAPRARRILVLAPHPDDESVGCGGYLTKMADEGAEITVAFVTDGELGATGRQDVALADRRRGESQAAMKVLGVRHSARWGLPDGHLVDNPPPMDLLRGLLKERDIEMILTPHPGESHPDHAAVARFVAEVAPYCSSETVVMAYEIWTPLVPDCIVDTTSRMSRKMQAVREYESQLDRFNLEGLVEGLGRYRAAWSRMRGWRFAEAFRRFDLAGYRAFCHAN